MKTWRVSILAALAIYLVTALQGFANSTYFDQIESIDHPDFGNVEFATLYGDGNIFLYPSRVVAIDGDGKLLAVTPLAERYIIRCIRTDPAPRCTVYDKFRALVFEPDFKQWARGEIIAQDGKPLGHAAPEYIEVEYGFTQRAATAREIAIFKATAVKLSPGGTIFAVLWWGVAWSFIARIFWRLKRDQWPIPPRKGMTVFLIILNASTFLAMSYLAMLVFVVAPYSKYFFWSVFLTGACLAFALMWLVARPRNSQATG